MFASRISSVFFQFFIELPPEHLTCETVSFKNEFVFYEISPVSTNIWDVDYVPRKKKMNARPDKQTQLHPHPRTIPRNSVTDPTHTKQKRHPTPTPTPWPTPTSDQTICGVLRNTAPDNMRFSLDNMRFSLPDNMRSSPEHGTRQYAV
jgi:hypothetical protein